jgi:hypothetical protein
MYTYRGGGGCGEERTCQKQKTGVPDRAPLGVVHGVRARHAGGLLILFSLPFSCDAHDGTCRPGECMPLFSRPSRRRRRRRLDAGVVRNLLLRALRGGGGGRV